MSNNFERLLDEVVNPVWVKQQSRKKTAKAKDKNKEQKKKSKLLRKMRKSQEKICN